jgi:hypothetical protein
MPTQKKTNPWEKVLNYFSLVILLNLIIAIILITIFGVIIPRPIGVEFIIAFLVITLIIASSVSIWMPNAKLAKLATPIITYARKWESKDEAKRKTDIQQNNVKLSDNVVGLLTRDKRRSFSIIYFSLTISFIIYALISYYSDNTISVATTLFFLFVLMAVFLNRYLLEYRLRKGFYGTTEYEAREVIDLILRHSDKSDFSDGEGLKKLFPEPENVESEAGGFVPSPGNAGI